MASLSATSFAERNECLVTHCRLVVKEERGSSSSARGFEVKGKMEERTVWQRQSESLRVEVADLLVLLTLVESLQNGTGFSRKT